MSETQESVPAATARFAARAFPLPATVDSELAGKEKKEAEAEHAAATTEADHHRAAFARSHGKKIEAMAKRLAPPQAGTYLVTPPAYGCKNRFTGKWRPGDKPREIKLTAKAAAELARPGQPFKLKLVPEKAPQE